MKDEEEMIFFQNGIETQGVSVEGEMNIARTRHLVGLAQNVWNGDLLRRIIGDKLRRYAIARIHGEPMQSRELLTRFTVDVFEPDGVAIASMDNETW